MHELTVLVLHIVFRQHHVLDTNAVAALDVDTRLIGDVHAVFEHGFHHTSSESPTHVLGTFVYVQNVSHTMSGAALVINIHIPDRLSCQNIQIPSGTAVEPVSVGKLHHCRSHHGIMLFHLIGDRTQCDGSGYIGGAAKILSAGIYQKHSLRLQSCTVLRCCLVMHHGCIGLIACNRWEGKV